MTSNVCLCWSKDFDSSQMCIFSVLMVCEDGDLYQKGFYDATVISICIFEVRIYLEEGHQQESKGKRFQEREGELSTIIADVDSLPASWFTKFDDFNVNQIIKTRPS